MTINVSGPDGVTIQFPDTMDGEAISRVMAQHFGSPEVKAKVSPITTGGVVSAALDVPVLGPVARKIDAGLRALGAPLTNPTGLIEQRPEPTLGGRYSAALESLEKPLQKFEEEHPVAAGLANVAGTTAATLPLAATAAGARVLGLGGRTLASQMGQGAASGAGINAVDAALRGNDPLAAAAIGGSIGGVVPGVARAISIPASAAINTVRGIVNTPEEAARRVGTAIGIDRAAGAAGLTDAQFAAEQARGTPVNLMDLGGETTRALARSAANTSPEGRQILNKAIDDRFATQSQRLSDDLNSTYNYPNAHAQQQALDVESRIVNRANYNRAMKEGEGGLWSPELERLAGSDAVAGAMQKAASATKDEAIIGGYGAMNPRITFTPDGRMQFTKGPSGVPTYPDLRFWDLTRRHLTDAATQAQMRGQATEAARLGIFAGHLNTELDKLVPSYAQARAGAAHFFGAENALDAGRKFALEGRTDNRAARDALDAMPDVQKKLFQDGFADALIQKIRSVPDRRNVVNSIANSDTAKEQLRVALGTQRANEFMGRLHVENVMDAARGAVQGNSTTIRQLTEMGLAGGASGLLSGDPQSVLNGALVYGALRHGATAALAGVNQKVATEVARLLTSGNPGQVRIGMNMLGRNPQLLESLRRFNVAFARSASRQLQPDQTKQ